MVIAAGLFCAQDILLVLIGIVFSVSVELEDDNSKFTSCIVRLILEERSESSKRSISVNNINTSSPRL